MSSRGEELLMRSKRASVCIFWLVVAMICGACSKSAPKTDQTTNADRSATTSSVAVNTNSAVGQSLDLTKLDAEIAQLEQKAEKNPEDESAREAVAQSYLRRGNAFYAARKLPEALKDFQSAVRFNPDNDEAQMRVTQVSQEINSEPRADDGRPVTVPTKPEKQ